MQTSCIARHPTCQSKSSIVKSIVKQKSLIEIEKLFRFPVLPAHLSDNPGYAQDYETESLAYPHRRGQRMAQVQCLDLGALRGCTRRPWQLVGIMTERGVMINKRGGTKIEGKTDNFPIILPKLFSNNPFYPKDVSRSIGQLVAIKRSRNKQDFRSG